jgi:hypothetical protein
MKAAIITHAIYRGRILRLRPSFTVWLSAVRVVAGNEPVEIVQIKRKCPAKCDYDGHERWVVFRRMCHSCSALEVR